MTVIRKIKEVKKVFIRKRHKPKISKRMSNTVHIITAQEPVSPIHNVPDEVLFQIFSYIPHEQLYCSVRLVCKRWRRIAMDPLLWKIIEVSNDIPTETLNEWIKSAPLLKKLALIDRNDANSITASTSRHSKELENIVISNCWGSKTTPCIYSRHLCNMINRCPKLCNITFNNVRFHSCKFFKLLVHSKPGHIQKKRRYFGPVSLKQYNTFIDAILENNCVKRVAVKNVLAAAKLQMRNTSTSPSASAIEHAPFSAPMRVGESIDCYPEIVITAEMQ